MKKKEEDKGKSLDIVKMSKLNQHAHPTSYQVS